MAATVAALVVAAARLRWVSESKSADSENVTSRRPVVGSFFAVTPRIWRRSTFMALLQVTLKFVTS
jgi:hypothetical protein